MKDRRPTRGRPPGSLYPCQLRVRIPQELADRLFAYARKRRQTTAQVLRAFLASLPATTMRYKPRAWTRRTPVPSTPLVPESPESLGA